MSVFSVLPLAPGDPILGMTDRYNADPASTKVNLGVGIYLDETGRLPLMRAVAAVEQDMAGSGAAHGYLPMSGLPALTAAVQSLVFGDNSPLVASGRVATVQALAGTGALRVGAGVLALVNPGATVVLSDPSWENHEALFGRAGFALAHYRYYDAANRGIDLDGMLADLEAAEPGSIVVLHACCHNPTGYDLTGEQWDQVVRILAARELVPFLDMAYQGFSAGVVEDTLAVQALANAGLSFLVANSFSKNFGLYGERIGGLSMVAATADEAARVLSQAKVVVRSLYSNPAMHGAVIVSTILGTPELRALWEDELAGMRDRLKAMRAGLRAGLEAAGAPGDFSYITAQAGMFSYSGLSLTQMQRLREEYHVYGLDSGRLCMAGLNQANLPYVVDAIAAVLKG